MIKPTAPADCRRHRACSPSCPGKPACAPAAPVAYASRLVAAAISPVPSACPSARPQPRASGPLTSVSVRVTTRATALQVTPNTNLKRRRSGPQARSSPAGAWQGSCGPRRSCGRHWPKGTAAGVAASRGPAWAAAWACCSALQD